MFAFRLESSSSPSNSTWKSRCGHEADRENQKTTVIAVGTALTGGPPHRSVRAALLHTALTLDVDE